MAIMEVKCSEVGEMTDLGWDGHKLVLIKMELCQIGQLKDNKRNGCKLVVRNVQHIEF